MLPFAVSYQLIKVQGRKMIALCECTDLCCYLKMVTVFMVLIMHNLQWHWHPCCLEDVVFLNLQILLLILPIMEN